MSAAAYAGRRFARMFRADEMRPRTQVVRNPAPKPKLFVVPVIVPWHRQQPVYGEARPAEPAARQMGGKRRLPDHPGNGYHRDSRHRRDRSRWHVSLRDHRGGRA